MSIGSNIKRMLEEKHITQCEFAEACGITQGMVTAIINGRKVPGIALAKCIAEYFGCTVDELICENK